MGESIGNKTNRPPLGNFYLVPVEVPRIPAISGVYFRFDRWKRGGSCEKKDCYTSRLISPTKVAYLLPVTCVKYSTSIVLARRGAALIRKKAGNEYETE